MKVSLATASIAGGDGRGVQRVLFASEGVGGAVLPGRKQLSPSPAGKTFLAGRSENPAA